MRPDVSIVIPAFNEQDILVDTVQQVSAIGSALSPCCEIVIVENGSTDATPQIADSLASPHIRVLHLPQGDYGAAIHAGLKAASGNFIVVFDCDLYDLDFAVNAVELLRTGRHIAVVASKRHPDSADSRSRFRRAGTAVFTGLIRRLVGLKASDTHGMKAFSMDVAPYVDAVRSRGHLFDTELIARCERAGFVTGELPCAVEELRPARSSYLSRVPSALKQAFLLRRHLRN